MKAIKSPAVSKYKKTFEQKFDSDKTVSPTVNSDTGGTKKWGVSRDAAAIGINFTTKDDKHGFPYTYLQRWRITLHGEIHLKYSEGLVIIKGNNLEPLYHDICRYRLFEIAVDDYSNGTIVDEINVKLNDEVLK